MLRLKTPQNSLCHSYKGGDPSLINLGNLMNVAEKSKIHYKQWESNFFGKTIFELDPIGSINVSADILAKMGKCLLQAKIPVQNYSDLDYLQSLGFKFVESELVFEKTLNTYPLPLPSHLLAQNEDIPLLSALAAEVFTISRFRMPWFREQDSSKLYAEWVKNAILKTFDDICFSLKNANQQIIGFVSGKMIDKQQARIGLIGLSSAYCGQRKGTELLHIIEQWSSSIGAKTLLVSTQGANDRACSFYLRNNYRLKAIYYWLYKENL